MASIELPSPLVTEPAEEAGFLWLCEPQEDGTEHVLLLNPNTLEQHLVAILREDGEFGEWADKVRLLVFGGIVYGDSPVEARLGNIVVGKMTFEEIEP